MLLNWAIFSIDVDLQYFTFKTSYIKLAVNLSIDKYCTHNNEQFGGCFTKIKQILRILQSYTTVFLAWLLISSTICDFFRGCL